MRSWYEMLLEMRISVENGYLDICMIIATIMFYYYLDLGFRASETNLSP